MLLLRILITAGLSAYCFVSGQMLAMPLVVLVLLTELILLVSNQGEAARRLQTALLKNETEKQSLGSLVETAICRLNTLQWEVKTGAEAGELAAEDGSQNQAEMASGLGPVTERLFDAVFKQFRCSRAALVMSPGESDKEQEPLVFTRGGSGGRFKSSLLRMLNSLCSAAKKPAFGLHDSSAAQDSAQDLSFFGIRYSIVYPLRKLRPGENHPPCLWLGYAFDSQPLSTEVDRARLFALQAGREISSEQKLEKLSGLVAEAESGSDRKSEFLAQMSHDLRTPLNNIKSILNLLRLEGFGEETPQMIDMAVNNCDSMQGLVEDILDYSKHRSGKLTASRRSFDLAQCVEEVHSSYAVMARLKGLDFRLKFSAGSAVVYADPGQMRRVVTNLVSNAIKYTQRGFVEIETSLCAELVRLSVRDSGSGMTAEQVQKLFTPFTTFNSGEQSGQPAGIGLGLALSRILAELNSGRIEVSSIPGSGSEFRVDLQAAAAQELPDELVQNFRELPRMEAVKNKPPVRQAVVGMALQKQESARAAEHKATVLVVDDDPDCVETLGRNLRLSGYRVLPCVSVREAIGILNFEQPDYVISDANMPDGGVGRVLEFVRRQRSAVPVAVLSGMENSAALREYTALGASGVFCKPVEMDELLAWLKSTPLRRVG